MKLKKSEKKKFIKDVNEMLETSCEDSGLFLTEKEIVGVGTPTEMLALLCTGLQNMISEKIMPKEVVQQSVIVAMAMASANESSDKNEDDDSSEELEELFDDLMGGEE